MTHEAVDEGSTATTRKPQPRTLSPEALDQAITTTTPRLWWALAAVVIALSLATLWSFFARIPQQVTATGVVSMLVYGVDVPAPASGSISHDVSLGTEVTSGDQLGQITPLDSGSPVEVRAPASGTLTSVDVNNGEAVSEGARLGRIVTRPDPAQGVSIVTYVSAADAITFDPGATVSIRAQNLSTASVLAADAVVVSVSSVPASPDTLGLEAGTEALAQEWKDTSGGVAYRVGLRFTSTAQLSVDETPQPGELITITNTYAEPHPVHLLFGS